MSLAVQGSASSLGVRWGAGILNEPFWVIGTKVGSPSANATLVSRTVSANKVGAVFGVQITAGEANEFTLSDGTSTYYFELAAAGVIFIVVPVAMLSGEKAGVAITVKNINVGSTDYQASILYEEQ